MYPNRLTTCRENLPVNRPQIWLDSSDWTIIRYSGAGIAIYFPDFGKNLIYQFLENGEFQKIQSQISRKRFKIGQRKSVDLITPLISTPFIFWRFLGQGAGESGGLQIFFDTFVECLRKQKRFVIWQRNLIGLSISTVLFFRIFFRFFRWKIRERERHKFSKKSMGEKRGENFQGPPHNKLQISSRIASGKRHKDVVAKPEVQIFICWCYTALPKKIPYFSKKRLGTHI